MNNQIIDYYFSSSNKRSEIISQSILDRDYELCTNNEKGYKFECETMQTLDGFNVDYDANPKQWNEWIQKQGEMVGYDIEININGKSIKVECKYLSGPIYDCWYNRDWDDKCADIIVTTCKWFVPEKSRLKAKSKNVKIMELTEFSNYILKLSITPNHSIWKLLDNNRLIESQIGKQEPEQAPKQELKQRFKQFLDKLLVLSSKGHGRFVSNPTSSTSTSNKENQSTANHGGPGRQSIEECDVCTENTQQSTSNNESPGSQMIDYNNIWKERLREQSTANDYRPGGLWNVNNQSLSARIKRAGKKVNQLVSTPARIWFFRIRAETLHRGLKSG